MSESILREDIPEEYNGRLPFPEELTRFGGEPGVRYCLVHGANLGAFRRNGWEMIRADTVGTVKGPLASCDNIVIMALGMPIPGADQMNGRRQWFVDPKILEETGLGEGHSPEWELESGEDQETQAAPETSA